MLFRSIHHNPANRWQYEGAVQGFWTRQVHTQDRTEVSLRGRQPVTELIRIGLFILLDVEC
jgi:hypothetical protein